MSERRLFGTDGIRGKANSSPMTAAMALRIGQAAGHLFSRGDRNRVLIGKDTRLSGYMLEPALTAGFVSAGMNVLLVGPMPTPAVAFLTRSLRADLGVMISASHNPFEDNGIKLFGPDGLKLSDETESEIEALIEGPADLGLVAPGALGRAQRITDAHGRYMENLKASFPRKLTLDGLRIAVDASHGAAYHLVNDLFWELGAEVVAVGDKPDGRNINRECGSTHPQLLRNTVLERRADVGIALDGDADRLVLLDQGGRVIDGDQVLALIASSWQRSERLRGGAVAATVMSNLGLERYLHSIGVGLERTKVGDRYVAEAMRERGLNVGGEQSGHIILSDYATTGDGLLAALQVLAVMVEAGRPLSEIGAVFEPLPQQLENVRVARALDLAHPDIEKVMAEQNARLSGCGRLLVRPSGTEPVIRVMVEAEDQSLMSDVLREVSGAILHASRSA